MPGPPAASPLPPEVATWVERQLGPVSLARFQDPAIRPALDRRLAEMSLEDAVLATAHELARTDREVADEFLGHFLVAMTRLGSLSISAGLQRFLDTGDLVDSVAGDIWRDLAQIEFPGRRQFLAYLARRMRWKASDHARRLHSGRRREDRRQPVEEEQLAAPSQPGPSTMVGQQEERERLVLAILRLPARDRELLTRHLRGESFAEIAAAMGLTHEAARKAIQRAMAKARDLLS